MTGAAGSRPRSRKSSNARCGIRRRPDRAPRRRSSRRLASARQAVRAAVEVQRGCREQSPGLPLGVGIGLDAGEAVPLPDGGYRGGALNLAARLCSIAAPGRILASEGVVHLARKVEGLQYRPRRAERLKGIADRVKSVEVVPDVPLPPVPALAAPREATCEHAGSSQARCPQPRWRRRWSPSCSSVRSSASSAIAANAAGLVDPHGHVVAEVPVSGRPAGVASAGSLWVTDSVNASLLRIDPKKRTVVDRIGVGANPGGVAVSPGAIWVATVTTAPSHVSIRPPTTSSTRFESATARPRRLRRWVRLGYQLARRNAYAARA